VPSTPYQAPAQACPPDQESDNDADQYLCVVMLFLPPASRVRFLTHLQNHLDPSEQLSLVFADLGNDGLFFQIDQIDAIQAVKLFHGHPVLVIDPSAQGSHLLNKEKSRELSICIELNSLDKHGLYTVILFFYETTLMDGLCQVIVGNSTNIFRYDIYLVFLFAK